MRHDASFTVPTVRLRLPFGRSQKRESKFSCSTYFLLHIPPFRAASEVRPNIDMLTSSPFRSTMLLIPVYQDSVYQAKLFILRLHIVKRRLDQSLRPSEDEHVVHCSSDSRRENFIPRPSSDRSFSFPITCFFSTSTVMSSSQGDATYRDGRPSLVACYKTATSLLICLKPVKFKEVLQKDGFQP